MIDAKVQAGKTKERDNDGRGDLRAGTGAARHGQAIDNAHQEDRQGRDRRRRRRIAAPAGDDRHAVRARPRQPVVDPLPDDLQEEQAAHEHHQMPPAPERHRQPHRRQPEHSHAPAGARDLDPVGHISQPRRPRARKEAEPPGVELITNPERRLVLGDQDRTGEDNGRQDQPCRGAERDRVRQRRRRARRAALAAGPPRAQASRQAGCAAATTAAPITDHRASPSGIAASPAVGRTRRRRRRRRRSPAGPSRSHAGRRWRSLSRASPWPAREAGIEPARAVVSTSAFPAGHNRWAVRPLTGRE